MTVASEAAKRSVTGDGRDATTSARPRPEPAVARTRKWHRASESGSTHWRSSTNRAAARCRASCRWTDSKIRMASRPPTSAPGSSSPWNVRSSLRRRQPAEQWGRRGQRHARLGLVAGEPVDPVAIERPPGFVEEPRLPDPGVPHEEQRADASFPPRGRDQRADGRHLVRPTDEHLAHAVRLRRRAMLPIRRRRRQCRAHAAPAPGLKTIRAMMTAKLTSSSRETRKTRLSSARAAVEVGPSASNSSAIFFVRGPM